MCQLKTYEKYVKKVDPNVLFIPTFSKKKKNYIVHLKRMTNVKKVDFFFMNEMSEKKTILFVFTCSIDTKN